MFALDIAARRALLMSSLDVMNAWMTFAAVSSSRWPCILPILVMCIMYFNGEGYWSYMLDCTCEGINFIMLNDDPRQDLLSHIILLT